MDSQLMFCSFIVSKTEGEILLLLVNRHKCGKYLLSS